MGKIAKTMHPSPALRGGQVIDRSSYVKLKAALHQWKAELPERLRVSPSSTRGIAHLHLTCEQAVMMLSRDSLGHSAAMKDDRATTQHRDKIKFLQDAARDCIAAAISTIQLFKELRDRKLLGRHSYQDPLYCSAALYILLLGTRLGPPPDTTGRLTAEAYLFFSHTPGQSTAAAEDPGFLWHSIVDTRQAPEIVSPDNQGQAAAASPMNNWTIGQQFWFTDPNNDFDTLEPNRPGDAETENFHI
ncbi:hypothetical protein DL769_010814 [Monosporascus sp. CRB-8-3]|nr:hypothetical protein DL769_010814 [Monosporascus sp. CRB-8-3]